MRRLDMGTGKENVKIEFEWQRTFRSSKMNHIAVFLEHIDLLNRLDRLYVELFQRRLKLFVVVTRCFVDLFRFSPWRTFAACFGMLSAIVKNRVGVVTGRGRLR